MLCTASTSDDRPDPPVRRRARLAQQTRRSTARRTPTSRTKPTNPNSASTCSEQVVRMIGEPEHPRLRHLRVEHEMVPAELTEADAEKRRVEEHQQRGLPDARPLLDHDLSRAETRRGSRACWVRAAASSSHGSSEQRHQRQCSTKRAVGGWRGSDPGPRSAADNAIRPAEIHPARCASRSG